ncbi:MAG TPA: GIY-YIG nuclease family protein [Thermomicrobiales bacterium]|nr:GIY-YIG nuclease family protein [Thermomicrobiales bacterium]
MGWWVYVVRCADGTLYTGVAARLLARLREHNADDRRAARYTRGRRPVALHAARRCADRGEALRLERAVKRLPRMRKAALAGADGWLSADDALRVAEAEEGTGAAADAPPGSDEQSAAHLRGALT